MKDLAYLNKFFYKYRTYFLLGILFVIISNLFGVLPAQVIRITFDLIRENISIYQLFHGFDRQLVIYQLFGYSLLLFGISILVLALLRGVFLFFMRQTLILMSRHIEYDLKNEIYTQYQKLSLAFYRRNNTGDLMNRITEDVSQVRMYLGPAVMYSINTLVLFILIVYAMFQVDTQLAIYCLLPMPILVLSIYYVNTIINHHSTKIQQQLSHLSSFVQETFSGIRIIKAYVREKEIKQKFAVASEQYKTNAMGLVQVQALFFPMMLLIIGLSIIITVYIGGMQMMRGNITSGHIAEFVVYVNQLTFPITLLGWVTSLVQRAAASQKRINEFLNTESEIYSMPTALHAPLQGHIQLDNVSFRYTDTGILALKDVTLDIKPGEVIAIIGRTGSGKTTLANLLMRMYDPTSGNILVDDYKISEINLAAYRNQIGFVPQDVFLFSDTIRNNILFGLEQRTDLEMEQATKDAAVYTNIMAFEKGFETLIGERGITLSGGQKQRISIARAILKEPKILIFDDCLSAVDTKTEEAILKNLSRVMKGKTSIIISHRVSTIKNADQIIVFDHAQIVEQGTHAQLMKNRSNYFELYQRQLLEEEA